MYEQLSKKSLLKGRIFRLNTKKQREIHENPTINLGNHRIVKKNSFTYDMDKTLSRRQD